MLRRYAGRLVFIGCCAMSTVIQSAADPARVPITIQAAEGTQRIVDGAVRDTLQEFAAAGLKSNQLAVTLVTLADPQSLTSGSYRGGERIYPASVVKLFYLAAVHRWLEDGKIQDSEELRRAMRDMIVDSYNEPTGYIVDVLTETTSGPELSTEEIEAWYRKRNAVNRYYETLGYVNINVNRKPWCEGPYGREMQSVKMHQPNHRNWLTTDATALLLAQIALGKEISEKRSNEMLQLLKREPRAAGGGDSQATEYTGRALPQGSRLWSKAGWTSQTRHDAAYVELPGGQKFVLVTFTVDHANNNNIIPSVTRGVIRRISRGN